MIINDLLDKYRRPLIVFTHFIIIIAAYLFSFYLRFEFFINHDYARLILKTLPLLILVKMSTFYYFKLFSGLWRYASTDDLWRIIKATSLSTVAFIMGGNLYLRVRGLPALRIYSGLDYLHKFSGRCPAIEPFVKRGVKVVRQQQQEQESPGCGGRRGRDHAVERIPQ